MIGKILQDRYIVEALIGEGGMSYVYRVLDKRTQHYAALKVLKPEFQTNTEFVRLFMREVEAIRRITHVNIVNLQDVWEEDGCTYLIMDFVEGRTLKDLIDEKNPRSEQEAAEIMLRVLNALETAHKQNIIHRDIKPQNILVSENGYVKVTDFGIAHLGESEHDEEADSLLMGSVYYFSPEQARGEKVTNRSDIYACGVVLYEMLTGAVPFEGEDAKEVQRKHITDPVPLPDSKNRISQGMQQIIAKAMEKDPVNRYQTAWEMAEDLQGVLKNLHNQQSLREQEEAQRRLEEENRLLEKKALQRRRRRKRQMTTAAVMLAVLMLLIVGGFGIYQSVLQSTVAPYVLGEMEEDGKMLALKARLRPEFIRQPSSKEAGRIILQSHDFGTKMRAGDVLLMTVSTGPALQKVPDLIGVGREEAEASLERIGLNLAVLDIVMHPSAVGTIIRQNPAEDTVLNTGGIVQVLISGGQVEIPDLVGQTQNEAVRQLKLLGVPERQIDIKLVPVKDKILYGLVASQLPKAKESFMPGKAANVVTLAVYAEDEGGK